MGVLVGRDAAVDVIQDLRRIYDAFPQPFVRFQFAEAELNAKGEPNPPQIVAAEQQGYTSFTAEFTPEA